MFQITADLSALTTEQREAIAAFILSFPQETHVIIPPFTVIPEDDGDEQSPEEAFALPTPAAPSSVQVAAALPALPTPIAVVAESADPTPRRNSSPFPPMGGVPGGNLDKRGLPWDERIHASSRVKIADGYWRTKRGIDDALVASVEAELKALMGLPVAPAVPPPPPAVADSPAAAFATTQSFVKLLTKASALIKDNKVTQEELNAAVLSVGVPTLVLLANRLDLVPQVEALLDVTAAGR